MANSRALTKEDALHELIEQTVQSHDKILKILRPGTETCDAFLSFFRGYFKFHAALGRYKLDEIMLGRSDP